MNDGIRFGGKRIAAFVAVSAAVAALTACGADSDTAAGATPADGPVPLSITTLGLCNEMPVYWAQDKGLFSEHGLEVELIKSQGGAAGLSALQSGEVDLAFSNPFSTMRAIDQGIGLKWIATAYETPVDETNKANSVAVKNGSPFTDAKSLEGKKIGVNEIAGINQIVTSEWMRVNGADPSTVEFVALPFADLGPAVSTGRIDAAQITEANMLPELDLVSLGNPYVTAGGGEPLVFSGYVATEKTSTTKPAALEAFQAALIESVEQLEAPENHEERYEVQSASCKQDAEQLKSLTEPPYAATVNVAALDRMGELLKREGILDNPPAAESYVADFAVVAE
ncbi:ABC transporter substrate-binding protein [Rhodococcus sp. NPDC060084]|uniref:ABC transporter substrate-binding protein n=1 Tax=Rhodococcus sp. NPDC060084 TaxID=3347053 RepID=UPI003653AEBB